MNSTRPDWIRILPAAAALGLLAACATPPPPPPVQVESVPYRPIPPGGASYAMVLPPLGPDGQWITANSGLDTDSTLWHFRSAWNVAALNCLEVAEEGPILAGYTRFLTQYRRQLTVANTAIDARFRREHGSRNAAVRAREAYMTQVYNYFALPPARGDFCSIALQVANEFLLAQPEDPKAFAAAALPRYEAAFQNFFRLYAQYQVDSGAWDTRYGARYGASQPGYVAVHGADGQSVAATLVDLNVPEPAGEVVDPETGARIPIIPVPEETVATPVVQPVEEGGR